MSWDPFYYNRYIRWLQVWFIRKIKSRSEENILLVELPTSFPPLGSFSVLLAGSMAQSSPISRGQLLPSFSQPETSVSLWIPDVSLCCFLSVLPDLLWTRNKEPLTVPLRYLSFLPSSPQTATWRAAGSLLLDERRSCHSHCPLACCMYTMKYNW